MNSFDKLIEKANKDYDGHFTLLKFTGNWRCCLGTFLYTTYFHTNNMAEGKTMDQAIENCLKDNVNVYDIYKLVS